MGLKIREEGLRSELAAGYSTMEIIGYCYTSVEGGINT